MKRFVFCFFLFFFFKKRIFPFRLLEDLREKLLGATETKTQQHIPCRAGGENVRAQIGLLWFS